MVDYLAPERNSFPWQSNVIRADLTAPPVSPSKGDRYIVDGTATGDWTGHEDDIAEYDGSAWDFYTPTEGWECWDELQNAYYSYSGTGWVARSQTAVKTTGLIDRLTLEQNATNPAYQIDISEGVCRNDDDDGDIESTSTVTVDITASGANGLDTGSEALNTWYFVWLIYNPVSDTVAGLFSLSSSSPTMPSGYTKKRRLGYVYNKGNGNFVDFVQLNYGRVRRYYFDADVANLAVLTNGNATSWTDVNCSTYCPTVCISAILLIAFESGTGGSGTDVLFMRPDGWSTDGTWRFNSSYVSTNKATTPHVEIIILNQRFEYKVSNTANRASISVIGTEDLI